MDRVMNRMRMWVAPSTILESCAVKGLRRPTGCLRKGGAPPWLPASSFWERNCWSRESRGTVGAQFFIVGKKKWRTVGDGHIFLSPYLYEELANIKF